MPYIIMQLLLAIELRLINYGQSYLNFFISFQVYSHEKLKQWPTMIQSSGRFGNGSVFCNLTLFNRHYRQALTNIAVSLYKP